MSYGKTREPLPTLKSNGPSFTIGNHQAVAAANVHINAYFRSVIQSIRSVKMILTSVQREILTSIDLTR